MFVCVLGDVLRGFFHVPSTKNTREDFTFYCTLCVLSADRLRRGFVALRPGWRGTRRWQKDFAAAVPAKFRSRRSAKSIEKANRRAVSGSAVRGRAELMNCPRQRWARKQRSRAAEQERRRHSQIARERISGVRSSGESHGRQRRIGALASRFVSGRKKKKMVEKNSAVS